MDGEAFSATAADTFNDALASSAEGFGLTVAGSVSPGPESPDDLQSSLDALLGRSGVNFAPESADLDDRSQAVLNSAAESIKQVPGAQVQIVGYTDNDGSPEGNLALSQARHRAYLDADPVATLKEALAVLAPAPAQPWQESA